MTFKLFTPLFETIDEATAAFVHDIATRCVVEITPVITVALTLSFITYGLLMMRGMVSLPATEFLGKAFRIALIVNIALAGGFYQSQIAGLIRTLPDDLATALIIKPSHGATAASLIDEAAGVGFDCVGDALNKAGLLSGEGLTFCLIAVIILFMTVIMVAVGGAFLLMSKIALSILAGLGPLFIVALIFPVSARFFELWLGQVMNYVLLVVLYAAVFGFMMSLFKTYMTGTKLDGLTHVGYTVGGVCIFSCAMLVILRQLPVVASSLAGGMALSFASGLRLSRGHQQSPSQITAAPTPTFSRLPRPANNPMPPTQAQIARPPSNQPMTYGYYKGRTARTANMN
jgi:type IV secretion system protein VirB6